MVGYNWKPINDLPDHWNLLVQEDVQSLASVWNDQAKKIRDSSSFHDFLERLKRRWAIETGIIEGLYDMARGITLTLVERGIQASLIPHGTVNRPVNEVVPLLLDQKAVIDGVFDFVAGRRELSCSYIKEIHAALTQHQRTVQAVDALGNRFDAEILRGTWKQTPNNPTTASGEIHEYCPPEHVQSEMDRLVQMHLAHIQRRVPPDVEAAWLHHRFTQIHPFQDGNGRVARALASIVFLKSGWFPLALDRSRRSDYIDALEKADHQDLKPLQVLFGQIQKEAFLEALSLSTDTLREHASLNTVLQATVSRLKQKDSAISEQRKQVLSVAENLAVRTENYLQQVAEDLTSVLRPMRPDSTVTVVRNKPDSTHWFFGQVLELARESGYFADVRTYHAWVRLKINELRQAELVVSFHSVGQEFIGLLAASAFLEYREKAEDEETRIVGPYDVARESFQFSYQEDPDLIKQRFDNWLRETIVIGLEQWRQQL